MRTTKTLINLLAWVGLLLTASNSSNAATRTWTGAAGTTIINNGANWSDNAAPAALGDIALWNGTVQTNEPFVWNGGFGPGSANNGATAFVIGAGYTSPLVLMNSGAGGNLAISNITIEAGAGPFQLGSNAVISTTVFRGANTAFINNSAHKATITENVIFNNGGGVGRTVLFGGSGDWEINSPWAPAGSGTMGLRVDGTGANTVTLNAGHTGVGQQGNSIGLGTLRLTHGDALALVGPQTLTIEGGTGTKRLALANDIILNAAVANLNIAGRDVVSTTADAAILNESGNNAISGVVRFNAAGGTNVLIHTTSGTLNLSGGLTAGGVTGNRYFLFSGAGTTYVNSLIENGSATLGLGLLSGTLVLNQANTYTGNSIINGGVLVLENSDGLANSTVLMSGGTLDLNGGAGIMPNLGGLAGPAGVVNTLSGGNPTLTVGNNNSSGTFGGTINNTSGSISLQKVGSGILTLTGANGYSGGTTVAGGTLLANNANGSGTSSGNVIVNSGASFGGTGTVQGNVNFQAGATARFVVTPTTLISGSNVTAFTVSGNVTLNGNPVIIDVPGDPLAVGTYKLMSYNNAGSSGAFAGTPTFVGNGAQLGTAASISTSGGTVTLTVTFTGVTSTWTNNGNGNWSAGPNWSSNPYYPQVSGDSATLGVGSAFTTVTLNTPITVATVSFTNENSFQIANAGSGLTFANQFGGAVVSVQAGASNAIAPAVTLNTNLTIATTAGTAVALTNSISNSGGTRSLTLTGPGTVVLSGNNTYGPTAGTVGTTVNGGVLQLGHNSAAGAGDVSLPSSATIRAGAALVLANNLLVGTGTTTVDNNGNNVTVSGSIGGAGNLTKIGSGTLTLNSASSYSGNSTIDDGMVKLGVAGAIPGGVGFGNVTINTNGVLDLNGTSPTFNGLNGAGTVDSTVGGVMTLTLGENGANSTFTGPIKNSAGSVALVKNGAGTTTLAGSNTYSGTTTINAGTLQIGNGGATGKLGAGAVVNNAVLQFNLTGSNAVANAISGPGQVNLANANLNLFLTGANSFSGNVVVNGGHLWVTNSASLGIGPKTVIVTGGGVSTLTTLHLAGNVTIDSSIGYQLSYSGGVVMNESGNNTLQGDIGLPFGGGAAYIVSKSGLLNLAGTISAINGGRTLQLGGAGNGVVSGSITDAGVGGAIGSVQKLDAGTWTLSGFNSYAAATAVNAGTLLVDGSNSGAGTVTVATNATFGGIGSISSPVVWQAGSTGYFTVTPSGSANTTPFTVVGNVTLNTNSLTVHIAGATPLPPGAYVLLNNLGGINSGSFATAPTFTGAGIASGSIAFVTTSDTAVTLIVANNSIWTSNANGNWTTGANWNSAPNFPNAAGQYATFGVSSSLRTVNLDVSQTIGGIFFTNNNSFVISHPANVLTLDNSGNGAAINVTGGTANAIATRVTLNDNTAANVGAGTALALSGSVSGFGSLNLAGSGVLSLSGSNTFSGNASVSGGTLVLGSTNAIGTGSLTISGGLLDSSTPNLVNANNNFQNWNASFGFVGSQNLNLGSGDVNLAANPTITVSNNTLTVGGMLSGSGGLTKAGSGTLALLGANGGTLFGNLTINDGTVAVGADSALGGGNLVFNSATAAIQSADANARTLANNVTASFGGIYRGPGDLNFIGIIASGNFPKTFAISNALTTFSGPFTDGGSPNGPNSKDGPGTLILSADNSALTKAMIVNAGTLALGSSTALGSGLLTLNGGGLDSTVPDLVNLFNNPQSWNGSFHFVGSENLDLGTGTVTMTAHTTITVSNKTLTVNGAINGGNFALSKAGPGTLLLTGATAYGNTTVGGGTLELAQATLSSNATVSVSSGAVLRLNFGTTNQISSLVLNGVSQPNGVYASSTPGGYLAGPGSLRVVYLGPSAPVQLTNSVTGSTLNLSWPAGQGWRLQAQTNDLNIGLNNNWSYLTDGSVSSTNIAIDPTKPTVFFRLVYP
jgi:fibronectin-binding autotransporter adhesin